MPPVNDDFDVAIELVGASGIETFDITGATVETGEYDPTGAGHSVWFFIVVPGDGSLELDTAATPAPRWDSYLAVFVGGFDAADEVAADDDSDLQPGITTPDGFGTSRVKFDVDGDTYHIQVGSYDYAADVDNPSAGYPRSGCKLRWTFRPAAIVSTAPHGGPPGTTIALTGPGIGSAISATFDGGSVSWGSGGPGSDSFSVTIPVGATAGSHTVTLHFPSGATVSTTVGVGDPPDIDSVDADGNRLGNYAGTIGSTVVIHGSNFTDTTEVTAGGIPVASFTVDSDSQISAVLPSGTATTTELVVTTIVDSASVTFTLLYPGPWRQDPDQWSGYLEASAYETNENTFFVNDGSPSFGALVDGPNYDAAAAGLLTDPRWDVSPFGSEDDPRWERFARESMLGFGFDLMTEEPDAYLPDVGPTTDDLAPTDVWWWQDDPADSADLTGDVQVVLFALSSFFSTEEDVADAVSTEPADDTDITSSKMVVFRAETTDFRWDTPPLDTLSQLAWLDPADLAARTRLAEPQVTSDGHLYPVDGITPIRFWAAERDSISVTLDLTLSDLDPLYTGVDLGFVVVIASSILTDDGNVVTLPSSYDSSSAYVGDVGKHVYGTGIAMQGRARYRPRRWRLLYTRPLGRPPLAHRQRRDGVAAAGAPLAHISSDGALRSVLAHRQNTP